MSQSSVKGNPTGVTELNNFKIIKYSSDFPIPDIDGYINTPDFTTYQISGNVTGDFKFKCGVKTSFVGIDRVNDKLISTTTGVMFTMDGTITTKSNILFTDITIGASNGTLFNVLSTTANQAIGMINLTIQDTSTLGTINNVSTWAMTNIVMRNCAKIAGYNITGTNGTIKCRLGVFSNNVGTTFDFGTSTLSVLDFNNNQIDCSTGQTFINGVAANVTTIAKLNNNIFSGAGVFINSLDTSNSFWNLNGNTGVLNTPIPITQTDLIGVIDGANSIFTSTTNFTYSNVKVFVNGQKQTIINDYQILNNTTIQFTFSPNEGEILTLEY